MEKIINQNLCTGCSVCVNICPKKAISLVEEKDGFKYPKIDKDKCINCGLCQKKCPVLSKKENKSLSECYVAFNKDEEEKQTASSGAIFSIIANYILDNDGIVIGAAFDKDNKLKHIATESKKDLDKLKGSKYLQSDIADIFQYVKHNIKDKKILFVGTPCQVAGIKTFINSDNLICIDLICHGVPTPRLFEKYIKYLEEKQNEKLLNYNFRDKTSGWTNYSTTAVFKEKRITELCRDNKYMKLFLSNMTLRNSCYNCNFKLGNKYSDITLGDFWGVENFYPEMYNEKGVSAIIINTLQGKTIFNEIKDKTIYKQCELEEIVDGNPSIKISSQKNKNRDSFFDDLNKLSYDRLVAKYAKDNIIKKIIKKIINKVKV